MGAKSSCLDAELLFKQHRILFSDDGRSSLSVQPGSLSSESDVRLLVDKMGESLESREKRVTGSIFIKRYSSLITGALDLWMHSGFAADLDGVKVSIEGGGMLFAISSQPKDRGDGFLRYLFADNASRVIKAVAAYAKVPEAVLWGNLSYLIVYRFEEWLRNAETAERKDRIQGTYRKILHEPEADWFPGRSGSPLTDHFRIVEDPLAAGRNILIRNKCCLSYRLPGKDRYCYTCPIISDACRIDKYKTLYGNK